MFVFSDSIAEYLGYKSTKNYLRKIKYIKAGIEIFQYHTSFNNYISENQWNEIHESFSHFLDETTGFRKYLFIFYGNLLGQENLLQTINNFNSMFRPPPGFRSEYNKKYIEQMLSCHEKFFDAGLPNKLTYEQRLAIIVDEDNNYINAGAGCGKTQTIISKIVFLVKKKNVDPKTILVLAFNKNAQEELKNRLSDLKIEKVVIKTFHSFGWDTYKQSTSSKKELIFADRNESRSKFIQESINNLFLKENGVLTTDFIHYFAYLLDEPKPKSREEVKNLTHKEYINYLKEGDMRSLNGFYLKSKQEVVIANFLYLNSIEFEYEKKYTHQEPFSQRNQYKPDFYLSEYNIWLEHFALNKNSEGQLESHYDGYKDDYEWKIKKHEAHNTELISTFSYQFSGGDKKFRQTLKRLLIDNGIEIKKLSLKDTIRDIKKHKGPTITKFAQLFETFLSLVKSSEEDPVQLYKKQLGDEGHRNKKFLELFIPIYDRYQKKLGTNHIDFDDMIGLASKAMKESKIEKNKYNYIMIDEFQDIGMGRLNLINALKKKNPQSKLLCVGDDWQAIYRFTGGDVNILFEFEKYFGTNSEELRLTKSFRLSNQLAQISNNFIRKNEKQSNKVIQSSKEIDIGVHIFCLNEEKDYKERLKVFEKIFKKINTLANGKKITVLILNRYNYDNLKAMYYKISGVLQKKYPSIKIQSSTIHRQKGAEFDFVILDDLIGDFIGFPNKMGEDTVLHMVMQEPEEFLDAEERRVFYVGITRSKIATFIIASRVKRSSFFDDIKNDSGVKIYDESIVCNKCDYGVMRLKVNNKTKEKFYSCSEYPDCYNTFSEKDMLINNPNIIQQAVKSVSRENGTSKKYEEKTKNSTLINKGFKVGDQVQHALFGIGTVLVITGSGEHQKVGVEFDSGLRKKLILKYAKLKKYEL